MAITDSLLGGLQSFITPDFIGKASALLGETPDRTRAGVKGALPTLLMGIANRGSTPEGARGLLKMIREDGFDEGIPSNFTSYLSGGQASSLFLNKGKDILSHIFGSNLGSVTDQVSGAMGSSNQTAIKLLSLLAPLAMGVLGAKAKKENWDSSALSLHLNGQKGGLKSLIPSGFGSIMDGHEHQKSQREINSNQTYEKDYRDRVRPIRGSSSNQRAEIQEEIFEEESESTVPNRGRWSIGMLIALIALIALGAFFLLKDRPTQQVAQAPQTTQQAGEAAPQPAPPPAPAEPHVVPPQEPQVQQQQPRPLPPSDAQTDTRRGKGFQPQQEAPAPEQETRS